jgi:mRNA interferase MazF
MSERALQWQVVRARLDPVEGSEQASVRPVMIVSREALNRVMRVVTVLPLTTYREGDRVYSTEVLLPADAAGQPNPSRVMAHQIRTIAKSRIEHHYGSLDDESLRDDVRTALRLYLDLD